CEPRAPETSAAPHPFGPGGARFEAPAWTGSTRPSSFGEPPFGAPLPDDELPRVVRRIDEREDAHFPVRVGGAPETPQAPSRAAPRPPFPPRPPAVPLVAGGPRPAPARGAPPPPPAGRAASDASRPRRERARDAGRACVITAADPRDAASALAPGDPVRR